VVGTQLPGARSGRGSVGMSTLQEQARALGDPTRYAIFRFVVDADRPVDVPELTDHLGLNHNAIRQHLAKLVEAELVQEGKAAAGGPGRPRLVYVVDPRTESRWGVAGPYERLSLWLTEVVRTGASPEDVGRAAGRRQRLGGSTDDDPVAVLVEEMARHGFDPKVEAEGGQVSITLQSCPFATAALADPGTVCQLHLGLARGVADNVDGLVVDELLPRDPREANCRLRCHLAADEATD
jgi:predicted ArsR family transcriptional regulator